MSSDPHKPTVLILWSCFGKTLYYDECKCINLIFIAAKAILVSQPDSFPFEEHKEVWFIAEMYKLGNSCEDRFFFLSSMAT